MNIFKVSRCHITSWSIFNIFYNTMHWVSQHMQDQISRFHNNSHILGFILLFPEYGGNMVHANLVYLLLNKYLSIWGKGVCGLPSSFRVMYHKVVCFQLDLYDLVATSYIKPPNVMDFHVGLVHFSVTWHICCWLCIINWHNQLIFSHIWTTKWPIKWACLATKSC